MTPLTAGASKYGKVKGTTELDLGLFPSKLPPTPTAVVA